jgi:DNA-directed RNA polymerase subunit M/transcription elongation factor TFIIS
MSRLQNPQIEIYCPNCNRIESNRVWYSLHMRMVDGVPHLFQTCTNCDAVAELHVDVEE